MSICFCLAEWICLLVHYQLMFKLVKKSLNKDLVRLKRGIYESKCHNKLRIARLF